MNTFYKLSIQQIIKETSTAVSILFNIPDNLKDKFQFIAGQYVTLKTMLNNEEIRRAYSICASPKSNQLKVAVKAIENGKFSTFATTLLKEGDELEVSIPEGKFIVQPQNDKNYIAFAAGSGITPVLSMITSVLESSNASITLMYGNKTAEDTIFYKQLNSLQEAHPQQFKLQYVYSKTRDESALFGRIDQDNVNSFIKNNCKNVTFDAAFLCGPEEMITNVTATLQENGFDKNNIHFELFTASTSEENISQIKDGETEITVMLDDEETSFTMKQTDTLLAASLRNKIDAPYSCQGGVCSSCIAKVTEGKAVMTKNSILSEEELSDGLVLTCQAHPTTPKVVVDFDDV